MLFNSIEFCVFLPIVFLLYWFVFNKNVKSRNIFLLIVSYIFYGWWDWRFLFLIFSSSIVDFIVGLKIANSEKPKTKRVFLWLSMSVNLGLLGFFKYYNFFAESFANAFTFMGAEISVDRLEIILPVGISFYTFQTMSYTLDIYKGSLKPTKEIFSFLSFVSFFPQLVAGPIERASNLLPQFYSIKEFDYGKAVLGLKHILWGLFCKVVIADSCAEYVNEIFENYDTQSSGVLALGLALFTLQIYGDFAGYSDIAIGTSKLFGFELKQNFKTPLFSKNITEFWRRWHISLSTWFNDYLFLNLTIHLRHWLNYGIGLSLILTFLISGLWHGAGWTFVIYGGIHGIAIAFEFFTKKKRKKIKKKVNSFAYNNISWVITFAYVCFSFIFFRSKDLFEAFDYCQILFSGLISKSFILDMFNFLYWKMEISLLLLLVLLYTLERVGQKNSHVIELLDSVKQTPVRAIIYYTFVLFIIYFGGEQQEFVYFQF